MNYKIISKFIKDISFEIPNAQTFVMLEQEISKYKLNFDVKSKQFKDNITCVESGLYHQYDSCNVFKNNFSLFSLRKRFGSSTSSAKQNSVCRPGILESTGHLPSSGP